MTSSRLQRAIAFSLLLVLGACQSVIAPELDKLEPWTTQLRNAQPDDAFAAIYVRRSQRLLFVGAQHATRTDSLTFRLIGQAYASLPIDTVIVEGSLYSDGPNSVRLMKWIESQRETDGFLEGGEAVPTIQGARVRDAEVWGGEPDDADIRNGVLGRGFSLQDLLGFYTLRSVPQWIRERKISGSDDERVKSLINGELEHNRKRLTAPATVLPNYTAWAHWYAQANQKDFGATFELEEVGPLADARYRSNKIAAAISRVRDEFLLTIIARHLNVRETVMVVFGASHLMILQPALDSMLGSPCYLGGRLDAAPSRCFPHEPARKKLGDRGAE
jgi:hypothetical protein